AGLFGVGKVGQNADRIDGVRHFLVGVQAGQFAKELEQVDHVDHVVDFAIGLHHLGPGNDERVPNAGLVGSALGACRIERPLDGGGQRAVVADDDDDGVAGLGIVVQVAVFVVFGNAGFDQQAAEFGVHGFDHAVLDDAHSQ